MDLERFPVEAGRSGRPARDSGPGDRRDYGYAFHGTKSVVWKVVQQPWPRLARQVHRRAFVLVARRQQLPLVVLRLAAA
jgi:hypothetical protein